MQPVIAYSCDDYRLILADRARPFRPVPAKDDLLTQACEGVFSMSGRPDAWQAFQLIIEPKRDVTVERIFCRGLDAEDEMTCLSTEGVDCRGRAFVRNETVQAGKPWPLWCLLKKHSAGTRRVELTAVIDGQECVMALDVSAYGSADSEAGTADRDLLARLSWLNGRAGISDEIPAPFVPIRVQGTLLSVLGRDIRLGADGFPEQIYTHFTGNNRKMIADARPILAAPTAIAVSRSGEAVRLKAQRLTFTKIGAQAVCWMAESAGDGVSMRVEGTLEFDGTAALYAFLKADKPDTYEVELRHTPAAGFDGLFIGLGVSGCKTPAQHSWTWQRDKHQDSFWLGGVNGGVMIKPRDRELPELLSNMYFHHGPNNEPLNWVNAGKGGFELEGGVCRYFSGPIVLDQNEKLFGAELMISPFKPVDQDRHFATRYYHGGPYKEDRWVSHAVENGCTHINYHHGNDGYPFINYPMFDETTFHSLIAGAHSKGMGLKPYYTLRELTSRLPEFWALRSLKEEIFPKPAFKFDGAAFLGGTDPFIKENLQDEVIPAWKHVFKNGPYAGTTDPAVVTKAISRLANFYVEGLDYMCRKWGIDGLYIDDSAIDRGIIRRVRRVLDGRRPGALIDMHTCNHFDDEYGTGWAHNALMYAQLMPYLDSLWIGEGFDYDHTSAEYILVEISGLPFGLMGEMLQDGGNPWRGLIYGMSSRFPCSPKSPLPVWRLWDEFGMNGAAMTGFWDSGAKIRADHEDVKCTVYEQASGNAMMICFANFAGEKVSFVPEGLPEGWRVSLPDIEGMQEKGVYDGGAIELDAAGGVVLWAEK